MIRGTWLIFFHFHADDMMISVYGFLFNSHAHEMRVTTDKRGIALHVQK